MKNVWIVFLLLISTALAQANDTTRVAVMDLQVSGIDQSSAVVFSDRLRFELIETGLFDVMERGRMDMVLTEQGFQQTGCTSTECMVEVGQLLGVDRMIIGSIGKIGDLYTISLQIIDVEKGRIILAQVEDCDCPVERVLTQAIRNIARKIAGHFTVDQATIVARVEQNGAKIAGTVTDIDGNVYQTVAIGDQVWMAENLRTSRYRNGDNIDHVNEKNIWAKLTTGAYCYYENDIDNAADYGGLYNWYAVIDKRNIAPEGWHVPTDDDWKKLEKTLGLSQREMDDTGYRGISVGGKLKEMGAMHWQKPNAGATNESGFTACAGGCCCKRLFSIFHFMGDFAYFWSSTADDNKNAWSRTLCYDNDDIRRISNSKQCGFSVRLVRD